MNLVIIGYDELEDGYKISITKGAWPQFQEVMNTGGKDIDVRFIFENNNDPVTELDKDFNPI